MTQCISKSKSAVTISVLGMNGGKKNKTTGNSPVCQSSSVSAPLVGPDGRVR